MSQMEKKKKTAAIMFATKHGARWQSEADQISFGDIQGAAFTWSR